MQLFGAHLAAAVEAFSIKLDAHKWMAMPAQVRRCTLSRGAPMCAAGVLQLWGGGQAALWGRWQQS
jgi:hypothetical protein